MPSESEYEEDLQREPGHNEAFLYLRRSYREAGRFDKLVTLYETRAQAIADQAKAAELFYLAAEVRIDQLADVAGAEADLAHAVNRDATHRKAVKRLKDIYREAGRASEYLKMLEVEAAALAKAKDTARIAEVRAEIERVYGQQIARIEHALSTPGLRAEVTADQLRIVEAARKIHNALGDYPMVCRLYEIELAGTADPKRRIALTFRLGRVLAEKIGDLTQAEQKLSDVVRLYPRDDKALEALASVYANPNWTGSEGSERAAGLYNQIARRRHEAGEVDSAVAALGKALAAVPHNGEALALLERVLTESSRFAELDRFLCDRVKQARTDDERMELLHKRAQLADTLGDPEAAIRTYEQVAALEPAGGPATRHLAQVYTGRKDWARLAELRERQLERTTDGSERLGLLRELAALYHDRLGDSERAAAHLQAILRDNPSDTQALKAYAEYFRARGSFRELADLLELAAEHDMKRGHLVAELLPRLEEVAVLVETKLADLDRALAVWRRMWELSPGYDRALEAQKRILQKTKRWEQMAPLLVDEAEQTVSPQAKAEVLHRLARLYAEKLEDYDGATKVYLEILRIDTHDAVALRNVAEAYEKTERWADLAPLLRGQVEAATSETERLALLRRVLSIYMEKLSDPSAASLTATEILNIVPGDTDALLRLESILEQLGDKPRLVDTLEYHTRYAGSANEKLLITKRIAALLQSDLHDFEKAIPYWERVVKGLPSDEEAIEALLEAYHHLGRNEDLARTLDLKVQAQEGQPAIQAEALRHLARLAGEALRQTDRAKAAWEALLLRQPADREGLEALSRIAAGTSDFAALASLLDRRIAIADSRADATALALERARIFEKDLLDLPAAIAALERVISEMDPANLDAHRALRRVAEAMADWPRVVAVAERQLALMTDPKDRVAAGLELGLLCRQRLGDLPKAVHAFESVLAIAEDHPQALAALAELFGEAGDGERLIAIQEKQLGLSQEPEARRELLFAMGEAAERMLKEPRRAFAFHLRAHREHPDQVTLGKLEGVAEAHALWEDLISVYLGEAARAPEAREQVEIALKVAALCEQRLHSPARAFTVLREALAYEPAGTTLLPLIERLGRELEDWQGLLDVYAQVGRGRPDVQDRVDLLRRRAAILEHNMNDPAGAFNEHVYAFVLDQESETSYREVLRLAEVTGRWEDALSVEAQLYARATDRTAKTDIARRAAALIEVKIGDNIRAFRAYLGAFQLAPDDQRTADALWRLAEKIGPYPAAAAPALTPRPAAAEERVATEAMSAAEPATGPVGAPPAGEMSHDVITGEIDIAEVDILEETPQPIPSPLVPIVTTAFATPWHEWAHAYELLPADPITRHGYLTKIADIWMRGAHDVVRALEALERAFALNPADDKICAEMERLAQSENQWQMVCGIYTRAAERGSRNDTVRFNLRVAEIGEQLADLRLAEERYQSVLVLEPSHGKALDRLEDIYRQAERWTELAAILERRVLAAGSRVEGAAMQSRAFELAELYEKRLERPYEAVDTLEKYVASIEEERTGANPSSAVVAKCRAGYAALARLLDKVGLAQKAAHAMCRELELAGDDEGARTASRHLAEIYEQELALPAKAIEVYEGILARCPEDAAALAALDRLHTSTGHFEALADVLERRISLAQGHDRAELIWRRARVLEERLGNPDAAAACLRGLGPEALSDPDTAAALLRNLRSAGLSQEAMDILEQRISTLRSAGGDAKLIAALYLEEAGIRANDLNDGAGALKALEAARSVAPDDPVVLAALARFHLKGGDLNAYATALLAQADASADSADKAAALLEAASVFKDQLADLEQARVCLERAIAEHPGSPEALGALAALEASEGHLDSAAGLYERQLAASEAAPAKAVVLTNLARILGHDPTRLEQAEARLDQALEIDPGHLPAIIALADIYYREQQWAKAERRLNEAMRRIRGQPDETARLCHRLGEVYEKLGRLEEGYRQLVEADRAVPGQLMLRIALGENRFQARRWRECATHLEGIADHDMASRYPDEVAQALTHAAQAELKLRRPERAAALHEAALRFSPSQPQTLRALADLALERGDKLEAARSLQRVAEACADRNERVQLFEQIGDLQVALGDKDAARAAYAAGAAAIENALPDHLSLLQKLLDLERGDGAWPEAIRSAQRIAEATPEAKARAGRRREVAGLQMENGDYAQAAQTLEKVLEDDPSDEVGMSELCVAYQKAERKADMARTLARLLPELPEPVEPTTQASRAELWEQLGEALTERDPEGAIAALQRSVSLANRLSTRLRLARLYRASPDSVELALANHRALIRLDPTCEETLRALATEYLANRQSDSAWCCLATLALLGLASDQDQAILQEHAQPQRATDEPYAASVGESERHALLAHPETRLLGEVFASLWQGLPDLSQTTLALGVGSKEKISAISELDVAKIFSQVGKALSNQRAGLFLKPDAEFTGIRLVAAPPTAIVMDKRFAEQAPIPELRFRIAQALELLRPELVLAATLDPLALDDLLQATLKAFHPKHNRWRAGSDDDAAEEATKLKKTLPYNLAKNIAKAFQDNLDVEPDCSRWRTVALETGARAGLLLCADLRTAACAVLHDSGTALPAEIPPQVLLEQARQPGPLKELLRYFISDDHFALREALGIAVKF
ncbi:MAG: tetratricopeptide repeat protein [Polyangia bacterium]